MARDDMLRLDRQVCFPLYAAARAMMQAYAPLLEALGVTYPQYLVLLVLWERDGVSVGDLGRRLYLDSGTLTPLLKRLERDGLVRRARSAHDERVVEIHLTAKGKKLRERALGVPAALVARCELPIEEVARLRNDLTRLYAKLRDVVERDAARKGTSS